MRNKVRWEENFGGGAISPVVVYVNSLEICADDGATYLTSLAFSWGEGGLLREHSRHMPAFPLSVASGIKKEDELPSNSSWRGCHTSVIAVTLLRPVTTENGRWGKIWVLELSKYCTWKWRHWPLLWSEGLRKNKM